MEQADPDGYDAITKTLKTLADSNVDPLKLINGLVGKKLVALARVQEMQAERTQVEKLNFVVTQVLKNGSAGVYEQFLECLSADATTEWVVGQIRGTNILYITHRHTRTVDIHTVFCSRATSSRKHQITSEYAIRN